MREARITLRSHGPSHRVSFDDAATLAALGGTTQASALARALGRRGHDVTVELGDRPVVHLKGTKPTLHPLGALLILLRAPLGRIPPLLRAWVSIHGREA